MPRWRAALSGARDIAGVPGEVTAVCHDSRAATPGALFVAIPGARADGTEYIAGAIAAGARAIVAQEDRRDRWAGIAPGDAAIVAVPDARVALAEAAAAFHGHPARALGVVGVTGTDGKTTTTHLVAHVLSACGLRAGFLSSVEFGAGGATRLNASHMTTLEADAVQAHLARVRDAGDAFAVVEASSIGLDMHRADQCEFDVGVFTNLTQDHLDYHGTMERYASAKAVLFRMLDASADKGYAKAAVLNADDPVSERMRAATHARAITYGFADADVSARDLQPDGLGMRFTVAAAGARIPARSPLPGEFNVANGLAAIAVAMSQGAPLTDAAVALSAFGGVPGRMERIDAGQPFTVIVDIASTGQAMRNVLSVLKPATPGRLIVVFGAAGERDRARRSGIARSVAALADTAIITNEDPRSEDPEAILAEIAGALDAASFTAHERIADRRSALARAFAVARAGDTVLLAGKGTEQSIVIGATHHPWDERVVARELLGG